MKKADFATIVLIAGFSAIVAFALANLFLDDPNDRSVTVQYLDVITSDIIQPDPELFNSTAINPTVETYVGQCRDGETWDNVTSACVSNEPATPEVGDEENEENEEDTNTESESPDQPTSGE